MATTGFSLKSTPNDGIFLNSAIRPRKLRPVSRLGLRMAVAAPTSFGFKNLMETIMVDVHRAENRALNVPLIAPFTIATSRLERVENVAIRIELRNGCVGWGEAPILPFVTAEDQPTAMATATEACEFLRRSPEMTLASALGEIGGILPGHEFASVRAGVEMALIDAVASDIGVPLWRLFGGVSNTITTDITIPIVSPAEAAALASKYRKQGFGTLKLKVGKNLNTDMEVLQAIRAVHPDCLFILDANEGYKPKEAVEVLEKLHEMRVTPVLFEQPVHRDDWEGLGYVSHIARNKYGVSVAADESCRSITDVKKIVEGGLVDVINIKLAKVGVVGALEIIEMARLSGLKLMIGGMVETRLAMGFAGHLAAGLGCFQFIDLDTPLLLSEDPVHGGYKVSGAVYEFTNSRGHGGFLHWDYIACKS
ncbi:Mandelate racemase/muconate lactonizing enzyme/methylaspartate ammonia-lyase [Parasponia andersonii]|uniref:Dipeptide epimerase n=1 Tax=Parasponia andersonii TaxID=3476 RepID=A0A2P5AQX3_PARAD|nr:Mandelate racemase/muconate lactonizing enzyme/methylaspartate ammonia-lyase [Parasponia andersonii]